MPNNTNNSSPRKHDIIEKCLQDVEFVSLFKELFPDISIDYYAVYYEIYSVIIESTYPFSTIAPLSDQTIITYLKYSMFFKCLFNKIKTAIKKKELKLVVKIDKDLCDNHPELPKELHYTLTEKYNKDRPLSTSASFMSVNFSIFLDDEDREYLYKSSPVSADLYCLFINMNSATMLCKTVSIRDSAFTYITKFTNLPQIKDFPITKKLYLVGGRSSHNEGECCKFSEFGPDLIKRLLQERVNYTIRNYY